MHRSEKAIFTSILRGNLDFATPPWPQISHPAKGERLWLHVLPAPVVLCHPVLALTLQPNVVVRSLLVETQKHTYPCPADLVRNILNFDTKQRATAEQILQVCMRWAGGRHALGSTHSSSCTAGSSAAAWRQVFSGSKQKLLFPPPFVVYSTRGCGSTEWRPTSRWIVWSSPACETLRVSSGFFSAFLRAQNLSGI